MNFLFGPPACYNIIKRINIENKPNCEPFSLHPSKRVNPGEPGSSLKEEGKSVLHEITALNNDMLVSAFIRSSEFALSDQI